MIPIIVLALAVNLYHYFFLEAPLRWADFLIGLMYGSLIVFFYVSLSKKRMPSIELDKHMIKAYQPKDLGYKEEHFEISPDDVVTISHKYNSLELETKSGLVHQLQLGRFSYSDAQKVKQYFQDLQIAQK